MRILVVIPHFFRPDGQGRYGSVRRDPQPRIDALSQSLRSLHGLFGQQQIAFQNQAPTGDSGLKIYATNQWTACELTVILCTTGDHHLIPHLPIAPDQFQHRSLDCPDRELGFYCHHILREHLSDNYDYYCYLEDDLTIRDPLFFLKQQWFQSFLSDREILQPNRFEISLDPTPNNPARKVYVDLEFESNTGQNVGFAHNFTENRVLDGQIFGQPIQFQRAGNPHAGCFFLTRSQMTYWAQRPDFGQPKQQFIGLLESAASLHLMRYFRVYKPALHCANFLEIEHWGNYNSQDLLQNYQEVVFKSQPFPINP